MPTIAPPAQKGGGFLFKNSFENVSGIKIRSLYLFYKRKKMKPYLIYISQPHNSQEIYIKDELTDEVLVTVQGNDIELAKAIESLMMNKSTVHK